MAAPKKRTRSKSRKPQAAVAAGMQENPEPVDGMEPVETTPYPRAGENPEFRSLVEKQIGGGDAEPCGDAAESGKRGPGRPPGTGKHQKAATALNEFQAAGIDETVMSSVFKGVFQAVAFALDEPSIRLTDAEAVAFSRPACVIWGYYMPTAISPVQAAWSQLGMVALGVVGARSAALSRGIQKRRAKQPAAEGTPPPAEPGLPPEKKIPKSGVTFTPAKE